jgi:hypothetical protein
MRVTKNLCQVPSTSFSSHITISFLSLHLYLRPYICVWSASLSCLLSCSISTVSHFILSSDLHWQCYHACVRSHWRRVQSLNETWLQPVWRGMHVHAWWCAWGHGFAAMWDCAQHTSMHMFTRTTHMCVYERMYMCAVPSPPLC